MPYQHRRYKSSGPIMTVYRYHRPQLIPGMGVLIGKYQREAQDIDMATRMADTRIATCLVFEGDTCPIYIGVLRNILRCLRGEQATWG